MDNLIKEEISRISELMELPKKVERQYNACQRFSENKRKKFLCDKIVSMKSWLSKPWGLDLRNIIDRKIEDLRSDIPDDLKQKFIEGAELLFSEGKITEEEKNNFIENNVKGGKLVYLNGEWQPINKLNTNYYDLGELLTDLIYKGGEKAKPIIQKVIQNPKEGLTLLKPKMEELVNKYFENSNVLNDYTKVTNETTRMGQVAEDKVKKELENLGFEEQYTGGNGDLIDMVFGVDLIMSSSEYGFKTIQVKETENAWRKDDKYPYVDWIIIATPFTIYDNRTKEVVKI